MGNPNLGSESAFSTNFGAVYDNGTLRASIDYWAFTFEDSFQTESFNSLLSAYTSNSCTGTGGVGGDSGVGDENRPKTAKKNVGLRKRKGKVKMFYNFQGAKIKFLKNIINKS